MPSPGYTAVGASNLRDASGTLITNATAVFTPNQSFRTGDPHGQTSLTPISVPVVNGTLSTVLADTEISNPANSSYKLIIVDNLTGDVLLGRGYEHIQPRGPAWSLDHYVIPVDGPLVLKVAGQGFNYRGVWTPSTTYSAYDFFTYGGNTYLALSTVMTSATFDASPFTVMAASGMPGQLTGDYRGAIRPSSVAFSSAGMQGGPSNIDSQYRLAFLDAAGRHVVAGFRKDGTVVGFDGMATAAQLSAIAAKIATINPLPPNSLDASFALLDAVGRRAVWYVKRDGTVVTGSSQITIPVLYGTSAIAPVTPPLRLPMSPDAFTASLNHVLIEGQSLSTGEDSKPALTTSQPYDNRMFNGSFGVLNTGDTQTALVPLRSYGTSGSGDASQRETCASGFADHIGSYVRRHRLTHPLLMSACGIPGIPYRQPNDSDPTHSLAGPTDFSPNGSQSYQWAMQHIASGKALASARYAHQAVLLIHGESDSYALHNPSYGSNLIAWQKDIQNGSNGITGDTANIPFLMKQCGLPFTGLQQLATAVASPATHLLACPDYIIPHTTAAQIDGGANNLHLTNYGQRLMGEYLAKAYIRHVLHGWLWTPLAPVSLTYSSHSVVLTYGGGDGTQLVLDPSYVSDPGHYGFTYSDGAGAQIVSVSVPGTNQIVLTFDRQLSASGRTLSYAVAGNTNSEGQGGPQYGARGCVRNSCAEMSYYPDASGNSVHLYDYSVAFSLSF